MAYSRERVGLGELVVRQREDRNRRARAAGTVELILLTVSTYKDSPLRRLSRESCLCAGLRSRSSVIVERIVMPLHNAGQGNAVLLGRVSERAVRGAELFASVLERARQVC